MASQDHANISSETDASSVKSGHSGIARNAFFNWLGLGCEMAVPLLLTPYLISKLGDTAYGTWIIIGSLTSYLGLLDFGLRGSVGRHVAFYRARNDLDGQEKIVNTALFTVAGIGMASFVVIALLARSLDSIAKIPADLSTSAHTALLILGLHLASFFVLRIFDAVLWGYERFDLLALVDGPAAALRGIFSATIVTLGFGLVGLAWVTLVMTLLIGVTKGLLCRKINPGLQLNVRFVQGTAFRELFGFGFWNFLVSIAAMARTQLSPLLIGATLGMSMVTAFSIVIRLINTASLFLGAGVGVLTPVATALHGQSDHARQRDLFVHSGKLCTAGALYFGTLFFCLGAPLLTLWIGVQFRWAWLPLIIMACGELIPMSVLMADNTIQGMGKNRRLAFRGIAECAMALGLAATLSRPYGLNGVCFALALSGTLWRGVFLFRQAANLLELDTRSYLRRSVSPILAASILPCGGLLFLVRLRSPGNWSELVLLTMAFSAVYFFVIGIVALGWDRVREILNAVWQRVAARRAIAD